MATLNFERNMTLKVADELVINVRGNNIEVSSGGEFTQPTMNPQPFPPYTNPMGQPYGAQSPYYPPQPYQQPSQYTPPRGARESFPCQSPTAHTKWDRSTPQPQSNHDCLNALMALYSRLCFEGENSSYKQPPQWGAYAVGSRVELSYKRHFITRSVNTGVVSLHFASSYICDKDDQVVHLFYVDGSAIESREFNVTPLSQPTPTAAPSTPWEETVLSCLNTNPFQQGCRNTLLNILKQITEFAKNECRKHNNNNEISYVNQTDEVTYEGDCWRVDSKGIRLCTAGDKAVFDVDEFCLLPTTDGDWDDEMIRYRVAKIEYQVKHLGVESEETKLGRSTVTDLCYRMLSFKLSDSAVSNYGNSIIYVITSDGFATVASKGQLNYITEELAYVRINTNGEGFIYPNVIGGAFKGLLESCHVSGVLTPNRKLLSKLMLSIFDGWGSTTIKRSSFSREVIENALAFLGELSKVLITPALFEIDDSLIISKKESVSSDTPYIELGGKGVTVNINGVSERGITLMSNLLWWARRVVVVVDNFEIANIVLLALQHLLKKGIENAKV